MTPSKNSFRTQVEVRANPARIALTQALLSLGSCFAETVGGHLADRQFNIVRNPCGMQFNPLSLARSLRRVLAGTSYTVAELFEHDGLWHSFDHHGDFSAASPEECLAAIHAGLAPAHALAPRLDGLLLTFGTAHAYYDRQDAGRVVANCHKLPAARFERRLLPVAEIVEAWTELLHELYALRPGLNVILTVSPVRHLRDDAHDNAVSKAHLLAAVHELELRFPALYYFPAYEIVLDELRDYRFFAPDMAHPNETATDYVWSRFVEACLAPRAQALVADFAPLLQARQHRPRHPESPAAAAFRRRLASLQTELQARYPELPAAADG